MYRYFPGVLALAGALALAGCDDVVSEDPPTNPQARPNAMVRAPQPSSPSEASQDLARYYKRLENDLVIQGLMRRDGGGVDTPFTDNDLLRNFVRIGFFEEYQRDKGLLPSQSGPVAIKKWTGPVRIGVEFGRNVPADVKASERARVAAYASRLARVTGHPITVSNASPNFVVLFMSNDDRAQSRARALEVIPAIAKSNLAIVTNLPRSTQCFVISAGVRSENDLGVALAYIRSELTDLQRLACIHEEIAQGLGLTNDSPRARPSIFNDDEEFALLTTHDEMLLEALYNPALKPGMGLEEARPILRRLFEKGAS
ncbi:DUF2927 domain-containing protein [Roseovarius sp. SK2]|uniref:DUF2927 domain-containing protein n=1 Tax=Roseovarius TaxID=74030 RepID=UPI00237A9700|nr:DUF2927 domain-containing protein [Roseovarius sp. SK2]MDD9724937.1 DUF2927 domain-containing protein [Roseovarius sp. SK2]